MNEEDFLEDDDFYDDDWFDEEETEEMANVKNVIFPNGTLEQVLPELINFNNTLHGSYPGCLVMKHDNGDLEIVPRPSNPCYGYLRKYQSTHGAEATQPEGKPGDLRYPFPKGEPFALAVPFGTCPENDLFNYVWSDRSPWIKGFGGEHTLIRTHSGPEGKEKFTGIILTNTDVDPTVMVNLLKFTYCYLPGSSLKWDTLRKEGLDEFEALCCVTLDFQQQYTPAASPVNTYMFPQMASLKKFKNGEPNDFSGGTFRKRFDYSRKNIQDIFADKENGIKFAAELYKTGVKFDGKPKTYAEAAKQVFKKYL
jgi:hypothetical protein